MGNGHNLHQDASLNTRDVHFFLDDLGSVLARYKPNIFNSEQGSQFTSRDFTEMLKTAEVDINMDGLKH